MHQAQQKRRLCAQFVWCYHWDRHERTCKFHRCTISSQVTANHQSIYSFATSTQTRFDCFDGESRQSRMTTVNPAQRRRNFITLEHQLMTRTFPMQYINIPFVYFHWLFLLLFCFYFTHKHDSFALSLPFALFLDLAYGKCDVLNFANSIF